MRVPFVFILTIFGAFGFESSNVSLRIFPENETINQNNELILIVHGWIGNWNEEWYENITESYLNRSENNIIIHVDWSKLASNPLYLPSAAACKTVGQYIADYLLDLNKNTSILFENIHIIGHSLGAHIAGYAGSKIQEEVGENIGQITALDAASPLYSIYAVPLFRALKSTDAQLVVGIHTDGGLLGMIEPYADVDIFANGGVPLQPGCPYLLPGQFSLSCSHKRSLYYYCTAIKNKNFIATQCDDYETYKKHKCDENEKIEITDIPKGVKGKFYFSTNSAPPFETFYKSSK